MALTIQNSSFANNGTATLTITNGDGRIVGTILLTDIKVVEDVRSRNATSMEFKYTPMTSIVEVGKNAEGGYQKSE